jgi:hypothetical protein
VLTLPGGGQPGQGGDREAFLLAWVDRRTVPPARVFCRSGSFLAQIFKNIPMKRFALFLGCSALAVALVQPANAAITRYTDRAVFEAASQPGFYLEPLMYDNHPNYSGSGFSYVGSLTGDRWPIGSDLSTTGRNPSVITFNFGPQIKAFGGYFYATKSADEFVSTSFQVSLNDGVSIYNELPTSKTSFYGFISDADFGNDKITVASTRYSTVGSVIVGTTTPVPGPLPVLEVVPREICDRPRP